MIHSSARDSITVQTEQVLIEKYDRLYRLAYSYVYNEDDALDIVQESACKAIRDCGQVKNTDFLSSFPIGGIHSWSKSVLKFFATLKFGSVIVVVSSPQCGEK